MVKRVGWHRVTEKAGSYDSRGFEALQCQECGEPIPEARRTAGPGVRLCIACQNELDQAESSGGGFNRRGSKDSQLR